MQILASVFKKKLNTDGSIYIFLVVFHLLRSRKSTKCPGWKENPMAIKVFIRIKCLIRLDLND